MNANHELTAYVANMAAQSLSWSLPFSKLPQNKMNEFLFEFCTFFKSSISATAPVILKALPTNFQSSLSSCKVKPKPVLHEQLPCNKSLDWRGRHERMAEGNLLMKFWLNKPLKLQPNTSQNEKGQRHKLLQRPLQTTTKSLTLE